MSVSLYIMFEIPTNNEIVECIITKNTVVNGEMPELVLNEVAKTTAKRTKKAIKQEKIDNAS